MGSALAPLPDSQATVISSAPCPTPLQAHFFLALILNIYCWARRSSEIQYRNKGRELTFTGCSLIIGCSGSLVNIILITGSAVTLQQPSGSEAQLYHILWPWPSDSTLVTIRFLFCKMEILQDCWMTHQTLWPWPTVVPIGVSWNPAPSKCFLLREAFLSLLKDGVPPFSFCLWFSPSS